MAVCPPRSWPVEKVMGSEEFFEYQRSIAIGCPDWDYRAKIWKPLDNETGAYDKDPETGKFSNDVPGLGKIFVCFDTVDHAKAARAELTKMLFGLDDNKKIVEGSYLKEDEFLSTIAKDDKGISQIGGSTTAAVTEDAK